MSIIGILIALLVFGLIMYLIQLAPIDPLVKKIIFAVAVVVLIIWLLQAFFGGGSLGNLKVS